MDRKYTQHTFRGKLTLVSWQQRRCTICQRFLSKWQIKYCAKCSKSKEVRKNYRKGNYLKHKKEILASNKIWKNSHPNYLKEWRHRKGINKRYNKMR